MLFKICLRAFADVEERDRPVSVLIGCDYPEIRCFYVYMEYFNHIKFALGHIKFALERGNAAWHPATSNYHVFSKVILSSLGL